MLQDQRAGHIQLPALPVDATATPRAADWPTVLEFDSPGQADPALAAGAATASAAAVADQRASLGERVANIEEEMAKPPAVYPLDKVICSLHLPRLLGAIHIIFGHFPGPLRVNQEQPEMAGAGFLGFSIW